jgi:putative hydrolase of the HAD superfamily
LVNRVPVFPDKSPARRGALSPAVFAAEVKVWVFDLDNTLYPPSSSVFDQIDRRMTAYIAGFLKVDPPSAFATQKAYYRRYGTSLCGMMTEHGMAPEPFLSYVHDIDHSVIAPDPELARLLAGLPGRRIVYTNGSAEHAGAVLGRLGAAGVFDAIFDIRAGDYVPKPQGGSYDRLISRLGFDPREAALVEDSLKNLPPAAERGMKTVWLKNQRPTAGDDLFDPAACDAVIEDLKVWLSAVIAACVKG